MLKIKEIKDIVQSLARSQGSYGRMYRQLEETKQWNEFKKVLNKAKVKNSLDLIMFVEC